MENRIYVSREREYVIYPRVGYCVCDDFFFAVMDGKASACQHLIAERLAEALSDYETVEVKEQSVKLADGGVEKPHTCSKGEGKFSKKVRL